MRTLKLICLFFVTFALMSACKKANDLSPTLLGDGIYFSKLNDAGMFCNVADGSVKLLNGKNLTVKNIKVVDENSFNVELTSTTSSSRVLFTKTMITKSDYEAAIIHSNKELSGLFYVHTAGRLAGQNSSLIMAVKLSNDYGNITVTLTKDDGSTYIYRGSGYVYYDCNLMACFQVGDAISYAGTQTVYFGHECGGESLPPTLTCNGQKCLVDVIDNGNSN